MTITNGSIVCKLTFPKASHYYQADKRHEVYGSILSPEGKIVHNLFGLWNEALYCGQSATARCIWRPGIKILTLQTVKFLNFRMQENLAVMDFPQKDANGIANSEDPDQTAPLGAV